MPQSDSRRRRLQLRKKAHAEFNRQIQSKSDRKLKARQERERSFWFGLGFMGLVGWSIAVPTLIGTAIGLWIDSRWESPYSWTLMLILLGALVGCINVWLWIQQENRGD